MHTVLALVLLHSLPSLARAAPATVVDHRLVVTVDAAKKLRSTVTWTVRIDDPAACAAGVLAPGGLDGATDGAAVVLEDLLIVPPDTAVGTVYTLTGTQTGPTGSHSGVFLTAPDLATQHASIVVDVPTSVPLTVWADPGAIPTFDVKRSRRVEMNWSDLGEGEPAQAAFSTFADWFQAAGTVGATVDGKLADKNTLGRDLAADIEGLGVAGITERTFAAVALEPGPFGDFASARPAAEVAKSGSGNAAERALLLISLLRLAGHDAVPGYFRPSGAHGAFPVTVPAPRLLPRPMVVVRRPEGPVYVDPASERASVPDRPASMLGATVWIPGELPLRLAEVGVVDGAVTINTTLNIDGNGAASWNSNVQATGAAQEYIRELLSPLDEAGRTEAMARLLRQARPGLERVQVSVTGAEKASKKLKLTVSGHQPDAMQAVEYGLRGTVSPTMAGAMAAWLPPRIRVSETVAVTPPTTVQVLGTALAPPSYRAEALIGRSLTREGQKVILAAEVERPYRATTPATDASAASFLLEEAPRGVELLLFTAVSSSSVKGLRASDDLSPSDRAVLEALLWYSTDNVGKAKKTLTKSAPVVGFEPLVAGLEKYSDPTDLRPWLGLSEAAALEDDKRILVVEGLERAGARRQAWLMASTLRAAANPDVQVRATLLMERVQGPKPDAETDPEGAALWSDPLSLLIEAQKAAAEIPGATAGADPRVVYRLAELSLQEGDLAGAEALLEKVERTALAEAMLAEASAMGGVPVDEIRARVDSAALKGAHDPLVMGACAEALARVGDTASALDFALTAARLAHHDPDLWSLVIKHALAGGDLPTAAAAAQRASDLEPTSRPRALRWETMATLLLDKDQVDAARIRAGLPVITNWPLTIDERMALDDLALFALLQHADATVTAEARLVSMRAQMRIGAGRLDEAARDGTALATQHNVPDGAALAFAATAGRQYSTTAGLALDAAAKSDPTAQTTRMEYRLISGSGDPLEDARRLGDDPRANSLLQWITKPAEAAAAVEGWPADVQTPAVRPPLGFKASKALSGPGVVGFSNVEAAVAFIRVGAVTGLLPPPIGNLYSVHPQAVERLEGGGQVLRLEGGIIPLYAAFAIAGDQEVVGLGFTVEGAKLALRAGLGG